MALHFKIDQGLQLPISGDPAQEIKDGPDIKRVGLVAADYVGMKPSLLVADGDRVKLGQPVFLDKRTEGVTYTSPASGVVESVIRGDKRHFVSLIIRVDGNESVAFRSWNNLNDVTGEVARGQLTESGLWTAFRTRPYNRVPSPSSEPHSIFVTAIDTNPLAPDPELIIGQKQEAFSAGMQIIPKLTSGKTYLCIRSGSRIPTGPNPNVVTASFEGVHPAGLPGTHIHFVDPVGPNKTVWFVGYQDVIAIGELFMLGQLRNKRIVSIAGPEVARPCMYRTVLGADLTNLVSGNADLKKVRVISGSVLSGRRCVEPESFLGRYHNQVSVLAEGNYREFLGWQRPGADRFSVTRAYLGGWLKAAKYRFDTNLNGGHRAMVPIGVYERVMPLDVLATPLLRALLTGETEQSQALGALELDEEDLALCTYVCPGKHDYGVLLRQHLTTIEKEG